MARDQLSDIDFKSAGRVKGLPSAAALGDATSLLENILYQARYPVFYHDFITSLTGLNGQSMVSGTFSSSPTPSAEHVGCVRFSCSTSANSGYRIVFDTDAVRFRGGEFFAMSFQTRATLSGVVYRLGWNDSADHNEPVDGLYLEMSGGVIYGRHSSNSTRSSTATSFAPATTTYYYGTIQVNDAATLVTYSIYSEAGALLWSDTLATNIPTAAGRETRWEFMAYCTGTGSAFSLIEMDFFLYAYLKPLVRGPS